MAEETRTGQGSRAGFGAGPGDSDNLLSEARLGAGAGPARGQRVGQEQRGGVGVDGEDAAAVPRAARRRYLCTPAPARFFIIPVLPVLLVGGWVGGFVGL